MLVVGAGTGMELLTLAEQYPHWRLTGVDPSAEMLTLAHERLQNTAGPIVSSYMTATHTNFLKQTATMPRRVC